MYKNINVQFIKQEKSIYEIDFKSNRSITGKQEASLYVSTIGLEEQQKPIVRPHGLPVYQIFYCTAGSGELVVNEERYCIEAGNGFS